MIFFTITDKKIFNLKTTKFLSIIFTIFFLFFYNNIAFCSEVINKNTSETIVKVNDATVEIIEIINKNVNRDLTSDKSELIELAINKTTAEVLAGGIFNLESLNPKAIYSNDLTKEINLSWNVTEGGGSISGLFFVAPKNLGNVKLMGTFTSETGVVKTINFTLGVIFADIFNDKGIVGSKGATFHLKNGITVEVPPNSIENTGEIIIDGPSNASSLAPQQTLVNINSKNRLNNIVIRVPLKIGVAKNVSLSFLLSAYEEYIGEILHPEGIVIGSECIFVLNTNRISSCTMGERRQISKLHGNKENFSLDGAAFIIETVDENDKSIIDCVNNIKISSSKLIKWPFYKQYFCTSWATCWLMLLKGYKKDLSVEPKKDDFDSIYKILKYTKMPFGFDFQLFYYVASITKKILGINDLESYYFPLMNKDTIPLLTKKITGKNMKAYYLHSEKLLLTYIINNINNDIPVMADFCGHNVLFVGYKYTGNSTHDFNEIINKTILIYHNPGGVFGGQKSFPYQESTLNSLTIDNEYARGYKDFIIHYITQPPLTNPNLNSIHLPDDRIISNYFKFYNSGRGNCVQFVKSNETIAWTSTDAWLISDYLEILDGHNSIESNKINGFSLKRQLKPDAYRWVEFTNEKISETNEISDFDDIEFRNIPIYDTSGIDTNECIIKIALSIYPVNSIKSGSEIFKTYLEIKYNETNEYSFSNLKSLDYNENFISVGQKFRDKAKQRSEFLMRVAVVNTSQKEHDLSNPNNYCDKFDLKFCYNPLTSKKQKNNK